jgi:hypothetical protein
LIGKRILQSLQDYYAGTAPSHDSSGCGIKCPAVSVGRRNPTLLVQVPAAFERVKRDPTREGNI